MNPSERGTPDGIRDADLQQRRTLECAQRGRAGEDHGRALRNHGETKSEADGTYRGGNRLINVVAATTVRNHGGKVTVSGGPIAETREQLGGYYVFECDDLDQVIGYAGLLPHGDMGWVEIRPVFPEPR